MDRPLRALHARAMPFGLHPAYLIILLAIILIIFGPGKLPELGSAVGRGMREFRKASDGITSPPAVELDEKPPATAPK
jgi:sec-independent protein translocase protein TatA